MDTLNENAELNAEQNEGELELELEEEVEETVSIPKSQFNKLNRKAIAYDTAKKGERTIKNSVPEPKPYNILEDEVADLILEGYSKEDTKFILANGGRKALEDSNSYVSVAIHAKREQKRAEQAASETPQGGYAFQGGKSYSEEQLRNMSPEEMEKVLPHA